MKEKIEFIVDFTVHTAGLWWPYAWPVILIFAAGFALWFGWETITSRRHIKRLKRIADAKRRVK
jgi:hypothetical protein